MHEGFSRGDESPEGRQKWTAQEQKFSCETYHKEFTRIFVSL